MDEYYRCPVGLIDVETVGSPSGDAGYFTFDESVCYGRPTSVSPTRYFGEESPDVSQAVEGAGTTVRLPFELSEVLANLRYERYRRGPDSSLERVMRASVWRRIYYFLRPALSVGVRKHIQRSRLAGWQDIAFPRWPVDLTVENVMASTLAIALRQGELDRIPFIWFWPNGSPGCVMMTHDVERAAGRDFAEQLMDMDDAFGIKSAFQLVPASGGSSDALWERIRSRGFEANLHDLNHDGKLFANKPEFLRRVAEINRYASERQCDGFRSGAMYREQSWFDAFEFSYDMSVPNVAHLEPQRGGCCTVMPYFVGDILELPLTTTQDYSLFHILGQYSTALWKQQMDLILSKNGLISFIVHPDYLRETRARKVYRDLLGHLAERRAAQDLWVALPGEVNRWWRNRQAMTLVNHGDSWDIVGTDSDRARVAYATLEDERLVFTLGDEPVEASA